MDALNDLEVLAELIREIVWAPNLAIGTMMKKEAETYAKRFEVYSSPVEEDKLRQALECAYQASGRISEKEQWKASMNASWALYERGVRQRIRAERNGSEASL